MWSFIIFNLVISDGLTYEQCLAKMVAEADRVGYQNVYCYQLKDGD